MGHRKFLGGAPGDGGDALDYPTQANRRLEWATGSFWMGDPATAAMRWTTPLKPTEGLNGPPEVFGWATRRLRRCAGLPHSSQQKA